MSLRMVEMVVRQTAETEVFALSEDSGVLDLWREPLDDDLVLLRLLVPSDKTEGVIRELEVKFRRTPGFRLLIFEVQATVPRPEMEKPKDDDEDGEPGEAEKEEKEKDPARIACDELVQKLASGAVVNRIFLMTVVLSTVVAAIGLLRDNVAVIIGAMVIAPLLGPNMTLALATTLGDPKLARRALKVNAAGIAVALVLSAAIGLVVTVNPEAAEIASRTDVSLSDIALALAAGSAGALAFTTGLSEAVVGVMVAVALLPPLATVGLLLGGGYPRLAVDVLLLLVTNIVCINIAGVGTFLWQKVTPRRWWEEKRAKRMVRVAGGIWTALLALLVLLILISHR